MLLLFGKAKRGLQQVCYRVISAISSFSNNNPHLLRTAVLYSNIRTHLLYCLDKNQNKQITETLRKYASAAPAARKINKAYKLNE